MHSAISVIVSLSKYVFIWQHIFSLPLLIPPMHGSKHEANQHFNHQKQQGIPESTADDPSAPNGQLLSEWYANTCSYSYT